MLFIDNFQDFSAIICVALKMSPKAYLSLAIILTIQHVQCELLTLGTVPASPSGKDVTSKVFSSGQENNIFPAAYGDFNGDKLTDIATIDKDRSTVTVYVASKEAPYMRPGPRMNFTEIKNFKQIDSVTMGDFTGDGLMDLLVTYTMIHKSPSLHNITLYCNHKEKNYTYNIRVTREMFPTAVLFCIGNGKSLNCSQPHEHLQQLVQEPMVLDLNRDMVLDLLGEYWKTQKSENRTIHLKYLNQQCHYTAYLPGFANKTKAVWVSEDGKPAEKIYTNVFKDPNNSFPFARPSCNAFVDVDGDSFPELVLITNETKSKHEEFVREEYQLYFNKDQSSMTIFLKTNSTINNDSVQVLGQSLFIDFERNGKLQHFIPFCSDKLCKSKMGLLASKDGTFYKLLLGPIPHAGEQWAFVPPVISPEYSDHCTILHAKDSPDKTECPESPHFPDGIEDFYQRSLILRAGDYNLDGYPDLIAVLESESQPRRRKAVIFENIPCISSGDSNINQCLFSRTFQANFNFLDRYENVISASFFDLKENGILDVFLVQGSQNNKTKENSHSLRAIETSPNADSYFIKVMVLSGRPCPKCLEQDVSYGNLIIGAQIQYKMKDVYSKVQTAIASQMYRSGYTTLDTPYTIFGIGHSPNFVDHLNVSLGYRFGPNSKNIFSHDSHQIIPNSQLIFIPSYPIMENMDKLSWKVKLFLTPSDAVLQTFGVLIGIITIVGTVALGLEYKERREDKTERMAEARRFLM